MHIGNFQHFQQLPPPPFHVHLFKITRSDITDKQLLPRYKRISRQFVFILGNNRSRFPKRIHQGESSHLTFIFSRDVKSPVFRQPLDIRNFKFVIIPPVKSKLYLFLLIFIHQPEIMFFRDQLVL